jgi:hypothetical protein
MYVAEGTIGVQCQEGHSQHQSVGPLISQVSAAVQLSLVTQEVDIFRQCPLISQVHSKYWRLTYLFYALQLRRIVNQNSLIPDPDWRREQLQFM